MNNDDLPSAGAGADPFSSPTRQNNPRSGSCLSWGLILTGALTSLFGCLMAFAGTAVQLEQQGDWGGYYAFLLLCPLPLIALGIILLIFGGVPLLKKRQIEDTLPD